MDIDGIRETKNRAPFEPFSLRLADGRELHVPHPDFLAFTKRHVIVTNPDNESYAVIEPLLVVSIECSKAGKASGAKNGKKK